MKPDSRASSQCCAPSPSKAGLSEIEGLDCIRMAERFERRLEEITRAWARSRDLEMRFAKSRRHLTEAKAKSENADAVLRDWRLVRVISGAALGLQGDVSIEGAETALQVGTRHPTTVRTTATEFAASPASNGT